MKSIPRNKERNQKHIKRQARKAVFYRNFTSNESRIIEGMTNWQRHQWAKAGWKKEAIKYFAGLKRKVQQEPPLVMA